MFGCRKDNWVWGRIKFGGKTYFIFNSIMFDYFVALGFELRFSHLPGRHCTT
jgi:hypothetical protein